MRSYFDALLRYFELSGRTGRAAYWLFQLVVVLLAIAAAVMDYRLAGAFDRRHIGPFSAFVAIFHFVPQVTITVRRLHDVGKSGWWYLLLFVPLAGLLVVVWTCYRSEAAANDYGDPMGSAQPPSPAASAAGSAPAFAGFGGARRSSLAAIQERRASMQRAVP